jgi:serine/threonine protein kinase
MAFPSRTEIVTAIKNPQTCYKARELIGGNVVYKGSNIIQYAGGYTTVFPFIDNSGKKVAIRCWCADIGDARKRSHAISNYLSNEKNPYFVKFKYVDNAILIAGQEQPVVVMDWVEGKPLKEYINDNCNSIAISALAEKFKLMVADFHKRNIAHGDLQHGNILVKSDGSLVVVDYDSIFIDAINGMPDVIKGLPGYQHPARGKNKTINPQLDYFSELVIYLSLLIFAENPSLWQNYYDAEDLLFSKDDFANIRKSMIYQKYCNSVNPVIANLCLKLEEFLSKNDIQDLMPLEVALVDKLEKAKEDIAYKWDNQPNPPQPKIIVLPDTNSISDKWDEQPNKPNSKLEVPDSENITEKF